MSEKKSPTQNGFRPFLKKPTWTKGGNLSCAEATSGNNIRQLDKKLKAYWKAWKPMIMLAVVGALITLLPFGCGIWLPDLMGTRHVLAEMHRENGETVRVIQFWRGSFHGSSHYRTEFEVHGANGELLEYVVLEDAYDTPKRWRIPLTVTSKGGRAHAVVTLSETAVKEIDW